MLYCSLCGKSTLAGPTEVNQCEKCGGKNFVSKPVLQPNVEPTVDKKEPDEKQSSKSWIDQSK